jgi:hypothetical protein
MMVRSEAWWTRLVVMVVGVGGFVGLLAASHYLQTGAVGLRWLAVIWFLGWGVFKWTLDLRARD